MREVRRVAAIVLVVFLMVGCSKNKEVATSVATDHDHEHNFGVERGFAPDAPLIVEEGELSEEPLFDTVNEAFEALPEPGELSAQNEMGPAAKRRTHTFSNGETFVYYVYQGVIFDGDVVLGTYKQLLADFTAYEEELKKRASSGEITTQGAFYEGYCAIRYFFVFGCQVRAGDPWETFRVDRDSIINNFDPVQQKAIFDALDFYDTNTDVNILYTTSPPRVVFKKTGTGCNSQKGKAYDQPQTISLDDNCFSKNSAGTAVTNIRTPLHEIGHALGMIHEHQRPDRNNYISINTSNLTQKGKDNLSGTIGTSSQTSYDYASIMHYTRFTDNLSFVLDKNQPMFNVTTSYTGVVGGSTLTSSDIAAVNARY
ncbi:MAG: M12 family metallopeptidase [Trueperaceae bacterium]